MPAAQPQRIIGVSPPTITAQSITTRPCRGPGQRGGPGRTGRTPTHDRGRCDPLDRIALARQGPRSAAPPLAYQIKQRAASGDWWATGWPTTENSILVCSHFSAIHGWWRWSAPCAPEAAFTDWIELQDGSACSLHARAVVAAGSSGRRARRGCSQPHVLAPEACARYLGWQGAGRSSVASFAAASGADGDKESPPTSGNDSNPPEPALFQVLGTPRRGAHQRDLPR